MNGENLLEQLAQAHSRIDALKDDNRLLGLALTAFEAEASEAAAENDRLRAVVDGSTTSVRDLTAVVDAAVAVDRSWSAVDTLDCPEDFQRALNDLSDAVRRLDGTEVNGRCR